MNPITVSQSAMLGAISGVILTTLIMILLIYYILLVISWWRIFKKAGEKGWKALIPFYNFYIQVKLTWDVKFFWITLVSIVVYGVLTGIYDYISGVAIPIVAIIVIALAIFIVVLSILSIVRLSRAFGHGIPFVLGLIFFNFIFMLILAFGKSKYLGNVYKDSKK